MLDVMRDVALSVIKVRQSAGPVCRGEMAFLFVQNELSFTDSSLRSLVRQTTSFRSIALKFYIMAPLSLARISCPPS